MDAKDPYLAYSEARAAQAAAVNLHAVLQPFLPPVAGQVWLQEMLRLIDATSAARRRWLDSHPDAWLGDEAPGLCLSDRRLLTDRAA